MVKIKNCTLAEFKRIIHNRKLTFVCLGKGFESFLKNSEDISYEICYLIDNHKFGDSYSIKGKNYNVVKVEELKGDIVDTIIVITSSKYSDEIVSQLDKIKTFDGVDVYIPELFDYYEPPFEFCNKVRPLIPKVIHYCWFGKSSLPDKFARNIETWKRFCPDYEIKCWNEDNYDIDKCLYMKQAYEDRKWGFVPDYARLDIIHTYGGIYLDVDVEMLRPWDELLTYPLFCGYENEHYVAFGLGFGAEKGNEIIYEMIQDYQHMDFHRELSEYNKPIPSPVHQTRILKRYGLACDGVSRDYGGFLALSPMYFAPVNLETGIRRPKKYSFSIHQYAGTWLDEDENLKKNDAIRKYSFLLRHMD